MWPPGSYPRYGAMAPEEPPATRLRGLRGWAGAQGSGFGVQVEGPSLFPQKAPLGFPIQVPLPTDCYAMEAETRNMKPEEFAACAGLVGCSSLDMACGIAFRLSQMAWHGAGFQSSQPDDVIKKGRRVMQTVLSSVSGFMAMKTKGKPERHYMHQRAHMLWIGFGNQLPMQKTTISQQHQYRVFENRRYPSQAVQKCVRISQDPISKPLAVGSLLQVCFK